MFKFHIENAHVTDQQHQQKEEQHGQLQQEQHQDQEPSVNTRSEKKVKKTTVHQMLNPYQCQICKQFYRCNSTLRTHVQEIHEKLNAEKDTKIVNKRNRQCQICQKIMTSNFLKKHISAVHEKLKPYQCQICYQFYKYKSTLRTHVQEIHKKLIAEKPPKV